MPGCFLLVLVGLIFTLTHANTTAPTDEPAQPIVRFLGSQACKECHPVPYKAWTGMKHARAYVILAWYVSREMVGEGDPPKQNKACLHCHSTAANLPVERRAPDFHIEDGVQCESCHGPGEHHVEKERARKEGKEMDFPKTADYSKPSEKTCKACHRPLAPHGTLKIPPLDYEKAWPLIEHEEEKNGLTPSESKETNGSK